MSLFHTLWVQLGAEIREFSKLHSPFTDYWSGVHIPLSIWPADFPLQKIAEQQCLNQGSQNRPVFSEIAFPGCCRSDQGHNPSDCMHCGWLQPSSWNSLQPAAVPWIRQEWFLLKDLCSGFRIVSCRRMVISHAQAMGSRLAALLPCYPVQW